MPKREQAVYFDDKAISIQSGSDTAKVNLGKTMLSSGRLLEQALTFGLADMDAEAGIQDSFQLVAI